MSKEEEFTSEEGSNVCNVCGNQSCNCIRDFLNIKEVNYPFWVKNGNS